MDGIRKNPIIKRITVPTTPAEAIQGNPAITVIPAKAGIQSMKIVNQAPNQSTIGLLDSGESRSDGCVFHGAIAMRGNPTPG